VSVQLLITSQACIVAKSKTELRENNGANKCSLVFRAKLPNSYSVMLESRNSSGSTPMPIPGIFIIMYILKQCSLLARGSGLA